MARKHRCKKRWLVYGLVALALLVLAGVLGFQFTQKSVLRQLTNGKLEGADYWTDQPQILSAGMGFDNIIRTPRVDGGSCSCRRGILVRRPHL